MASIAASAQADALVPGMTLDQFQLATTGPTQAIDAPPVDRLFDDWDGLQPKLQSLGINLQFNALTEFAGNVTGGTQRGSTFASQIGFSTDINWERLTGLSTHTIIVNRSGASDSHSFGDNLMPVRRSTVPAAMSPFTSYPPMPRRRLTAAGSVSRSAG